MADWVDLIIRKREGETLTPEEVSSFVEAIQREEIAMEQASAFLMAIVLNGLDEAETGAFTRALMSSGQMLRFTDLTYPPADIAETGGIGGNAALVALPVAAAFGVKIPVLGERSLRHVGGLLDKFEAIPNFRTDINAQEFQESVRNVGMAVTGQTTEMAPAEIRMNQIRANTGTIGGVSLTLASLLARKGSVGARGLVAEIACGSGGLAKNLQQAHDMADQIFNVGEDLGFHVGGVITDRDNPLGNAIGDSLEMQEAIAVLKGEGPEDLRELAVNLAAGLLIVSQMVTDLNRGRALALEAIRDQRAFKKLKEMVSNQGGDTQVLDNPEMLPRGQGKREVVMQRGGYVKSIDTGSLGAAWLHLGGSRNRRGEATDHRVGLLVHKKIGDRVEKGEPIVTLHSSEKSKVDLAIEAVEEAFLISPNPVEKRRLILENFGRAR
jgi:pyrimidine-nucleoside phosphorylase